MSGSADPRAFLRALFDRAVEVADPMRSLADHLPPSPASGRLVVVGAGKASARMADAIEAAWGPCEGQVMTGPTLTNVNDFRAILVEGE